MSRLVEYKTPLLDADDAASDAGSDVSKEDADVTTRLLGRSDGAPLPLGVPEVRRRFRFGRGKLVDDAHNIATQVMFA